MRTDPRSDAKAVQLRACFLWLPFPDAHRRFISISTKKKKSHQFLKLDVFFLKKILCEVKTHAIIVVPYRSNKTLKELKDESTVHNFHFSANVVDVGFFSNRATRLTWPRKQTRV